MEPGTNEPSKIEKTYTNEEGVIARKGAESRAGIGEVDEVEEIRDDGALLVQHEVPDDPELCGLVEDVEWQRDGGEELHDAVTTAAQRSQSSGCAGSAPTVRR